MAAATGFNQVLETMAQADFFTGILPFLVSFIVFYVTLKNLPILKGLDDDSNLSALLAVLFAFFVARFLMVNPLYQTFFVDYFGRITIGLIGLLGLMILLTFVGWEPGNGDGLPVPIITLLALLAVVGAFGISNGFFAFIPANSLPFVGVSLQTLAEAFVNSGLIYLVIIGGAIAWAIADSDDSDDDDWQDHFLKFLGAN